MNVISMEFKDKGGQRAAFGQASCSCADNLNGPSQRYGNIKKLKLKRYTWPLLLPIMVCYVYLHEQKLRT